MTGVSKDVESSPDYEVAEERIIQAKHGSRLKSNFVVLNKHTLSQLKTVKHIPAVRLKKVFYSRGSDIRCISASGRLNSIDSKAPRMVSTMKTAAFKLRNLARLYPSEIQQLPGGELQKNGFLIKRNHMKNLTVRQINVVQPKKKEASHVNGSREPLKFTTQKN